MQRYVMDNPVIYLLWLSIVIECVRNPILIIMY